MSKQVTTVKSMVELAATMGYTPLQAVKRFAEKNYEHNGWDVVVEACTDQDLLDVIGDTQSVSVAIRRVYVGIVKPTKIHHELCDAQANQE